MLIRGTALLAALVLGGSACSPYRPSPKAIDRAMEERAPIEENAVTAGAAPAGENVALTVDPDAPPDPEILSERVKYLKQRQAVLLGPEDVLLVQVDENPDLNSTVIVDPWGFIKLPYVDALYVKGMTVDVVQDILTQKYSTFFLKPPGVHVRVEEYNSQAIYVLGAVDQEGRYPFIKGRPMTLRDVVFEAGLPTDRAAEWRVWIVRQTPTGQSFRHVNLKKILYRGDLTENVLLQPGDIVYVPLTIIDRIVLFFSKIFNPIFGSSTRVISATTAAPTPQ